MSNETSTKADAQHGDEIANTEKNTEINTGANTETKVGINTETKEPKEGKRTVSFNRDVHVKRFGKPRERGPSSESPSIRKEPFTHLSERELIEEANKVIAQAQSVTCTADHPPEKFFSLPHRRKFKEDRSTRRNSDDVSPDGIVKSPLGRSTSDVTPKKRRERTSLSTLFRRSQRNKSPESPVVVTTKPVAVVKRSKSDVSDLKSNTNLTKIKPIRKRSGSETEEFLKSLRNKKTQLSPIIESSPREDYFKKVSPLEVFQKQQLSEKESINSDTEQRSVTDYKRVNPIEKPPRYKGQDNQEPKPPSRSKRGKSSETEKEPSPPIGETPKRKVEVKKTNLANDIAEQAKETPEVKEKIRDSIRKIEENVYGTKDMIHSSQQPPDKPPLTRGHTVDHMVRILKEDQHSSPPKSHLISPSHGSNINQPFSYTKPSASPDPNLFVRTSPERVLTPVNKMNDKGVVYAQVIKDHDDFRTNIKQPMHKKFSPSREKYGNFSDEDEGLGYEERLKYSSDRLHDYEYKHEKKFDSLDGFNVKESPIIPRFREYKLRNFDDLEPTYANEKPKKDILRDPIESFRGRADGMDTKKKTFEPDTKLDLDFNELSHRRQLLESRLNARRYERERIINNEEPISRFLAETDPIYEAEKRMKQTEKYVNDTVKYYRHTLERDGFESNLTEDYKYDTDSHKIKYNTETRTFHKAPKGEVDRREFIDSLERPPRFKDETKIFPPEPEYEPPSLESNPGKPVSPDEYKEKKYKAKKNFNSSHEFLHSGQKYKVKDDWFGKRKGHYSSNPEIAQEREDEYANLRYHPKQESFHNSLRRVKNKDKDYKGYNSVRRHDSGDSRDYYREQMSPRRYDFDSRLVDSGIENDFRINSNGDIHRTRLRRQESDDDVRNTSLFLANERQYAEDNYASEQIYANGDYLAKFKDYRDEDIKGYAPERNDDDSKLGRYEKSPKHEDKVSAKPPKAKKLSGLEKVKQLFSRDSSKKSKKEKEKDAVQEKTRTRVLKSPEHLARHDSDYRRYTDPEPSDTEVRKIDHRDDRKYKNSRENLDRYPREEKRRDESYKDSDFDDRFDRPLKEERRYKERPEERRRHTSSERESDHQRDRESERRKTRSRTAGPLDSPALAERYRERRRLATPSPTPSPPRRQPTQSSSWFKSLDRLGKKREKSTKIEKESIITTEDESPRRAWAKSSKPLNSPAKNLRFFGDTDHESDANVKTVKTKNHTTKSHGTLRKTISNSSAGLDEVDHSELSSKSYSLSNLHRDEKRRDSESPRTKEYYKRNLQNISEMSNSEVESHFGRNGKMATKPPISPYDRSRSHSSNKTLKGSKGDVRKHTRDDRGNSSELRSRKPEINRDVKHRRRTPVTNSGESSTEGDSSHQSQRSVVYLHATTVGDIPDPGRMARNRSRDDVSSVMSSNIQVRNTTKSFSIFAPWTPKHYNDQYDVHYAQKPKKKKETTPKKYSSTKNLTDDRPATLQKKSYSQTTLSRRPNQNNRLTSSSTTLYRSQKSGNDVSQTQSTIPRKSTNGRSQSSEILNRDERDRVSRSISIPKDKKAGWFKLSKNKKQENTRVR